MALNYVRQEYLYLCVQEMQKEGYAITEICNILDLNRSSYYKWTHCPKSSRELENEALLHDIGLIYAEHNGTYGYRRIADEYNATLEKKYNLKRFYRLVHIVGLLAVIRRKRPSYQRSTPEITAENELNREFTANRYCLLTDSGICCWTMGLRFRNISIGYHSYLLINNLIVAHIFLIFNTIGVAFFRIVGVLYVAKNLYY